MTMRKTILATALLLVSTHTLAQNDPNSPTIMSNFNYEYIEARFGASPATIGAAISKSIHPNAYMIARVDSEFESDFDLAAGFGFNAPMNNWADLTGEMLFRVQDKREYRRAETGMELSLGIRQWLGPQLEVGGKGGYISINDEDEWIGSVYARFHSTELFSLGLEARINDAYKEQLMLTARFKY